MRSLMAVVALGLILAVAGTAQAVTLVFDPNDILDLYPTQAGVANVSGDSKATQEDARRFHATWGSTYYETFFNPVNPHAQPADYNAYLSWRNSLDTPGEGIACFNTWFLNNSPAGSWGETVVTKPGTSVSATAASGWAYSFITNPYGLGGTSVQWYTLDSAEYLRPTDLGGANIGEFSITIDLYHDLTGNGWSADDTPVLPGESIRFWLGGINGDDPEFYRTDTLALYFDGANNGGGAGQAGSGFEAAMQATALPVPEPITMAGLMMGVGGVVGYVRRRARK
jgi:hypothetical protein